MTPATLLVLGVSLITAVVLVGAVVMVALIVAGPNSRRGHTRNPTNHHLKGPTRHGRC